MRNACIAISPSSKFGTNSLPSLLTEKPAIPTRPIAATTTNQRTLSAKVNEGRYSASEDLMMIFSFSLTGPLNKIAIAAGTKVIDNNIAQHKAITTVIAIGWNIFPSTPVSANIGKYTAVIMNTPNKAGRMTSFVASKTNDKRSFSSIVRPFEEAVLSLLMQFSTIIMAPSTSKPKSNAPKLIKFALTFVCTMPVIVINMAKGITAAVSNAARILPNKRNSTTITNNAPSKRFIFTVSKVFSTNLVRS